PELVQGGFIFGAAGGDGVFLARDRATGDWSYPAFYSVGSGSVGLQVGAVVAEVALMPMTKAGVDAMLAGGLKMGAEASAAAGSVGGGAKAATVDILAFSKSRGLYGGLTADGTWVEPRDGWNAEYYGKPIRPVEILLLRSVENPQADRLRASLAALTG
ncbi:MAG: lipid-binding SYLF domain-containing protein, partial [Candidatus Binatia bacterium]